MAADHPAGIAAAVQAAELARGFDSPWPGFEAARLHAVGLAQSGRAAEALAVIEPYRALVEARRRPSSAATSGPTTPTCSTRRGACATPTSRCSRRSTTPRRSATSPSWRRSPRTWRPSRATSARCPRRSRSRSARSRCRRSSARPTGPRAPWSRPTSACTAAWSAATARRCSGSTPRIACFVRDKQAVWIAVASNHKAQLLIDLGQFARARQALDYERPPIDHVRARGATIAARLERALGRSRAGADRARPSPSSARAPIRTCACTCCSTAPTATTPPPAMQRCDEVLQMALALEFAGVAMKARMLRAHAQSRAGDVAAAAAAMRELSRRSQQVQPADLYFGEAWWIAAQVFEANGDGDDALMALAQGAQWVRRVGAAERAGSVSRQLPAAQPEQPGAARRRRRPARPVTRR